MSRPPHEPTAPFKPIVRGRGDTPPPAPPHELPRASASDRRFDHDGATWVARLSGKGACGTGSYGLGLFEAVHFYDAADLDRPIREALLAFGRFDDLFDEELAALLVQATVIVHPDG
ncbi:MAG TPA: hypothetical protein VK928_11060 [Longimicrobiales bacterium]|nr:hypothetical protein [Longimicrobiales bacterium]